MAVVPVADGADVLTRLNEKIAVIERLLSLAACFRANSIRGLAGGKISCPLKLQRTLTLRFTRLRRARLEIAFQLRFSKLYPIKKTRLTASISDRMA
ncbi:MAG: hypothetical protein COX19_16965 [Desulfobacterales bacterium CG23_combo_of_CG06-09_8_20_14_all_51_8]|nr:MAG: hypothetical protein COX19_16965 [Desulfobacterales bacterium CG23_combo_of_CG06-09_8_20_14_all_51_8]